MGRNIPRDAAPFLASFPLDPLAAAAAVSDTILTGEVPPPPPLRFLPEFGKSGRKREEAFSRYRPFFAAWSPGNEERMGAVGRKGEKGD